MASLSLEGELLQARLEGNREEQGEAARRHLDENWSLGSGLGLRDELPGLHKHFSREEADAASSSASSSPDSSVAGACRLSPRHTTDRLVRSLQVSVSVREPPQPPPRASSLCVPPVELTSSSSDEEGDWSQSWGRETAASPSTMASNLVTLNSRLFQQRPRIGAAAVALVETSSGHNEPETETGEDEVTSEDEETSVSSHSSSDSDTWGGAFSLRNTQSLRSHLSGPPNDAAVVSRLTARTLTAVTDALGVPEMLRPCFALEAARLQLCLGLAAHQAIACDRNCEGEESDSDSDDDFLASDTESDEEVPDLEPANLGSGNEVEDSSDDENLSDFSHSWLGSQPDLGPRSTSSPRLSSSPGAWLSDREDLQRMREFLARSSPGSDFNRSTASEEDD